MRGDKTFAQDKTSLGKPCAALLKSYFETYKLKAIQLSHVSLKFLINYIKQKSFLIYLISLHKLLSFNLCPTLRPNYLFLVTSDAVQFQDRWVLYKFTQDSYLDDFPDEVPLPSREEIREAETRKDDAISILLKKAPDAVLRAILRKQ